MKKSILAILLLTTNLHAIPYTWNGTVSSAWSTPSNWISSTMGPSNGTFTGAQLKVPNYEIVYDGSLGSTTYGGANLAGLTVGIGSTNATMTITGGNFSTALATGTGRDQIGGVNGTSTLNISGGNFTGSPAGTNLGISQTNSATLNVNAGAATLTTLTCDAMASATNLNGGMLTLNQIRTTFTARAPELNFNGGTLRAGASAGASFTPSALKHYIQSGGGTIDTNGQAIQIGAPLLHGSSSPNDGGLTKTGSGTLTLTGEGTYNGDTRVTAGTLQLNGSSTGSPSNILSGPAGTGKIIISSGGGLTGDGDILNPIQISGNTFFGTGGSSSTNLILSGNLTNASPADTLTKTGEGAVTLANPNGYNGNIHIQSGILKATIPQALGIASTPGKLTVAKEGTLSITYGGDRWTSQNVASLLTNNPIEGTLDFFLPYFFEATAYNSNISGNLTISLSEGNLMLGGQNSHTGGITINRAGLQIPSAAALGTGPLKINGYGSISSLTGNQITIPNPVNIKVGSTFYTGSSLATNELRLSGNITFESGAAIKGESPTTISGPIAGDGPLTTLGELTITNANTYAGGTNLQGLVHLGGNATGSVGAILSSPLGTGPITANSWGGFSPGLASDSSTPRTILNPIQIQSSITLGDSATPGKLTFLDVIDLGGGTATINTRSPSRMEGEVRNGGILKTGAGELTLTANNTYSGATEITEGTLTIADQGKIAGTSGISVTNGTLKITTNNTAPLGTAQTWLTNATLEYGIEGGNATSTESTGTIGISGSSTIKTAQAGTAGNSTLTIPEILHTGTIDFQGTGLGEGTRNRIILTNAPSLTNGILGGWATFQNSGFASYDPVLGVKAYSGYTDIAARGSSLSSNASANVRINSAGAGGSIELGAGTTTINTLFQNTGTAATVNTAGKTIALSGILITPGKSGVTIGENPQDGEIIPAIPNGEIVLNNQSGNPLVINAQLGNNGGGASLQTTGDVVLTCGLTYNGSTTISAGSLTIPANESQIQTGPIAGTGTLIKTGSGTTTLNQPNAHTGGTSILAGTLITTDPAGLGFGPLVNNGTITLAEGTSFNNKLSGTGTININVGANTNLFQGDFSNFQGVWNIGDGNQTGTTVIQAQQNKDAIFNIKPLAKLVDGGFELINNGTANLEGTLEIAPSGTWGGDIILKNANASLRGDYGTISGVIKEIGAMPLNVNSAGSITLLGNNTYTGGTNIQGGTLTIGNGGTSGKLGSGPITNNGWLIFNRSDSVLQTEAISGAGGLTQFGPGSLILTSANTFNGSTVIAGGAITLNNDLALGSSPVEISVDGTLNLSNTSRPQIGGLAGSGGLTIPLGTELNINTPEGTSISSTGNITGAGALTKTGEGTQILDATNSYTGGTLVNGGTLIAQMPASLPGFNTPGKILLAAGRLEIPFGTPGWEAADVTSLLANGNGIASGGSLALNVTGNQTLLADITQTNLKLNKAGDGTLLLAGNSTYSGTTTLEAGTLLLGAGAPLGTSHIIIQKGTLAGNSQANLVLANQITLSGNITLGGNITLQGKTTLTKPVQITADYTTRLEGDIEGPHALTIAGNGATMLGGNSTYGDTIFNQKTLKLGSSSTGAPGAIISGPLGTGNVTLASTIGVFSDNQDPRTILNPITLNGSATFGSENTGNLTFGGGLKLTGNTTLQITNAIEFSGDISGGDIVKTGNGTLTLSGHNSQNITATTSPGSLNLNSSHALGTGTLTLDSPATINNTSGSAVNLAGGLSANASITFGGSSPLAFSKTTMRNANLNVVNLGGASLNLGNLTTKGNGTITATNQTAIFEDITPGLGNSTTIKLGPNTPALSGNIQINGNISNPANGTTSISILPGNSVLLRGQSTYTGGTTLAGTTVQIGSSGISANGTVQSGPFGKGNITISTGTLTSDSAETRGIPNPIQINNSVTIGSTQNTGKIVLDGEVNLNGYVGAPDRIITTLSTLEIKGKITNGDIGKNGAGTLIISGNQTYKNWINLNAGTLIIRDTNKSSIDVNSGTTVSSDGSLDYILLNNGGTLRAGLDEMDTATLSLTRIESYGTIELGLGANGTHDTLQISTPTPLRYGQTFHFLDQGATPGTTYTGIITGLYSNTDTSGWTVTNPGWSVVFTNNNGSIDVLLVPEPSTAALLMTTAVSCGWLYRKNRRRQG